MVNCEQVWLEISNYVENDLDSAQRAAMDEHIRGCKDCGSVLAGTRNVIQLYGDDRLFQAPFGYSWRLRGKLAANIPARKGTAFGWLIGVAAMGLIAGSLAIAGYATHERTPIISKLAQPGNRIPGQLTVLVVPHTKVFHVAGCTFIHDKEQGLKSMTASEAEEEGYVPCVRCLGKYLIQTATDYLRKRGWVAA